MAETPEIEIILASASPRRAELLRLTGWRFDLCPVEVDETPGSNEPASDLARRLAQAKAEAALRVNPEAKFLLAADTLVVDREQVMGKPQDEEDARRMLVSLRGRTHRVISALVLMGSAGEQMQVCETSVPMRAYEPDQVAAYIESGSPLDKAGAYGIQDRDFHPVDVERMSGCFANVMGLPLCHLLRAMRRLGEDSRKDVPLACQSHTSYDCPVHAEILRGGN
jgi:septum formation protein